MKIYFNGPDAVIGLHKDGFRDDFQLINDKLFWVQGKLFIRAGNFTLVEYHTIIETGINRNGFVVIGISVPQYHVKGILITHHHPGANRWSPMMTRKIKELNQVANANCPG